MLFFKSGKGAFIKYFSFSDVENMTLNNIAHILMFVINYG